MPKIILDSFKDFELWILYDALETEYYHAKSEGNSIYMKSINNVQLKVIGLLSKVEGDV